MRDPRYYNSRTVSRVPRSLSHGPRSRNICRASNNRGPREELVGGTHPFIFILATCYLVSVRLVAYYLVTLRPTTL